MNICFKRCKAICLQRSSPISIQMAMLTLASVQNGICTCLVYQIYVNCTAQSEVVKQLERISCKGHVYVNNVKTNHGNNVLEMFL